ncbi:MAG: CxxxxCH/CxxCH domain-containing protein [Candidatus Hydrogenedentes bacterium]|nr:CxxxxCH/CxxCH domain-containing protein [Candidatus Hydrogenedentota bacterium]
MRLIAEFALRRCVAYVLLVAVVAAGNAVAFAQDGAPRPHPYQLSAPVRITFTSAGAVLVSDHRLQKILTLDKNTLELRNEFTIAGSPSGLAVGNGFYYVGNESAKRVEVYDQAGTWQYNLGGDYTIQQPNDISVDASSGQVFVVDTQKRCVRVFGRDGAYVRSIPAGAADPLVLANPTCVALDETRQEVLVSDFGAEEASIGARVQIFKYDGTYAATIAGTDADQGTRFSRPQGLAADGYGHVFLVDSLSGLLLILDRETGKQLGKFGAFGSGPGQLLLPLDLVIDPVSKDVLVTNNRAQRIEVFNQVAAQVAVSHVGDVDLSGSANAVDVQLVINKALGLDIAGKYYCDVDQSGSVDAVDVQLVTNAALGLVIGAKGKAEGSPAKPVSTTKMAHGVSSPATAGDWTMLALAGAVMIGRSRAGSGRAARWARRPKVGRLLVPALMAGMFAASSVAYAQTSVHECTYCHGVWEPGGQTLLHNAEVEVLCLTCHGPGGISVLKADVHTNHAGSSQTFRMTCTDCHDTYNNQLNWHGGTNLKLVLSEIATPNNGPQQVAFESLGSTAGGATLHSFADNDEDGDGIYDGVCETCHTLTGNHRNNSTGNHAHYAGQNCTSCHPHDGSFLPAGGACDSCHGAPPATGAHLKHFGGVAGLATYGGVENLSTSTDYVFDCGSCHPISFDKHRNGVVDIELYNAAAPATSLKARNPSNASYVPGQTTFTDSNGIDYSLGTCSNVYCHSKTSWSSPNPISDPLVDSLTGIYIGDANGNLTYNPYTVTQSTIYTSMGWGDSPLTCNGCHRNGPQNSAPGVQAGVGDSHSWIDEYGYDNLHAWNMGFDPLTCRTCHYDTVTSSMTWTRDANGVATYSDVPIANKAKHVNGAKDVAFDRIDPVVYNSTFSLAASTYNPADKTCSSVPCHVSQARPQWGKPYRWYTNECDYCHQYSGKFPPPPAKAALAPHKVSPIHAAPVAQDCKKCHSGIR